MTARKRKRCPDGAHKAAIFRGNIAGVPSSQLRDLDERLRTDLEARHSDLPGFFLRSWNESKDCCENTDRGSDFCFRVCNRRLRNDVGRVALRYFVSVEWDAGGMKRPGARCARPFVV